MPKLLPDNDYIWGESLDSIFYTAIVKRLTTPNKLLPAYKLGLIDLQGKILREPKSKEERRALTGIDRIALMMKRYMRGSTRLIYNEYRKRRLNPAFIRAAARGGALRYGKYFDIDIPFYDANQSVVD
jgi:hypothetical protein